VKTFNKKPSFVVQQSEQSEQIASGHLHGSQHMGPVLQLGFENENRNTLDNISKQAKNQKKRMQQELN